MNKPDLSVCIPAYNIEKHIEKCIRSVMNQKLKNIEIIVVNDGSVDNTLEIIKKLKEEDSRIIIINQKNKGLSSARNLAIDKARGKYIAHLDGDDWIQEDAYQKMIDIASNYELDMVITDYNIDFGIDKVHFKDFTNFIENKIYSSKDIFEALNKGSGSITIWNKIIKRSLYIDNEIRHPLGINNGEDLATTPKLYYYTKKMKVIHNPFIHYVQHDGNMSLGMNWKKLEQIFLALKILKKFFKDKNEEELYKIFVRDHLLGNICTIKDVFLFSDYKKYKIIFIEILDSLVINKSFYSFSKKKKILILFPKIFESSKLLFIEIYLYKKIEKIIKFCGIFKGENRCFIK